MLVGILTGDSLRSYYEATRLAPVQFIVPPAVWLSSPTENIQTSVIQSLNDESSKHVVRMKTTLFRHLYNPENGMPGFFAALTPESSSMSELRHTLGILEADEPFIPSMLMCHDGMRSHSTKQFCRALSESLFREVLNFELFMVDKNNPEHSTLFNNYNQETQKAFSHAIAYK